jgi:transcription initiation factor TFIIA large subunit
MPAAGQQQPQAQPAQQQAPLVLQVDGTGDTSSEEDEDEEEDYDDDEEEDKEKDGAEDGQVEEVSFYKSFEKKRHSSFTFAKHANYMLFFSPRGRERWMLALSFFHILSNPQA